MNGTTVLDETTRNDAVTGNEPTKKTAMFFMIDTLCEMAGSERNLFETVTRLDPRRYESTVVCMRGTSMVDALRERGIEAINLDLVRIYSLSALAAAFRLMRMIRRKNVSVMVTYHNASDYYGAIIARLAGVPVLISSRRDMGYKLARRHILMYRLVNRLFDGIIVVSEAVKEAVAEREHVPRHKMTTVYNGVDCGKFSPPPEGAQVRHLLRLRDGDPVVGMIAVVRPVKGHTYFLQAASLVRKKFPNARFLVVGWYEDRAYYNRIRAMARELGLARSVVFTGGRADVPKLLSVMDVSVFASLNEGFPNAVLESMAAGKPVIATNSGGTAEAVVNGETGLLVAPRNPRALADAMITLLGDRDLARSMGERGRKRAEEMFSMSRMIRQMEELCDTLLARKADGSGRRPMSVDGVVRLLKRSAKGLVSGVVYYTGLLRMGAKFSPKNGNIKILAYHRVNDDDFTLPGMSIKVANFEQHLRYIKKQYHPLSLDSVVRMLEAGKAIPPNAIVITFDDGYRDNYLNAFPLLKKYRIPATIFLSISAIDRREPLWFDSITQAFKLTATASIDLSDYGLESYPLRTVEERIAAANSTVAFAKRLKNKDRDDFIALMLWELDVERAAVIANSGMTSWQEVIEMSREGITFGSHGMSHTILTHLSSDELEYEVAASKATIKERTGIDITLFSYPNGQPGDFNDEVERLLKKYGYLTACTLEKGSNNGVSNRLRLKRLCVTEGMESNAFGRFSEPLFAFMLARY